MHVKLLPRVSEFWKSVQRTWCWSIALAGYLSISFLYANPVGESVQHGTVSFERDNNTLTVQQKSDKSIIHWKNFSIGKNELTQFIQPGSQAAALNRVLSGKPSEIYGTLTANGRIFLINPSGVLVGPGGVVNTQSFVASTLDVLNEDFLNGGELQFIGDSAEGIINCGSINALGGDVFLISLNVDNSGDINADDGAAGLAAGQQVLLKDGTGERLFVEVAPAEETEQKSVGLNNTGRIEAARAELQAAGGNMYALAINNEGTIRASQAVEENGRVLLKADGGAVSHSGNIEAPSGEISVTGQDVKVEEGAVIDATGENGGLIEIGGGFQGKGTLPNSRKTVVEGGAEIHADGTDGDGGQIVLWSDGITEFRGTATATAAGRDGVGGLVEISGLEELTLDGHVSTTAESGLTGTLLLDPVNILIAASDNPDGNLTPEQISSAVGSNHVVVHTTDSEKTENGIIEVRAPIEYDSENSLTFLAHSNVDVSENIQNSGSGDLTLVAGWDGVTEAPGGNGPEPTSIGEPFDVQSLLNTPDAYGNDNAFVVLANWSGTSTAVGSRGGTTSLLGYDVTLWGEQNKDILNAPRMIGYLKQAGDTGEAAGDIFVDAHNLVHCRYGASYWQIGHGTEGPPLNASGNIVVHADNDVEWFRRYEETSAFGRIGHGGPAPDGEPGNTLSGDITVTAGKNVEIYGDMADSAYAQIGHGGTDFDDTMSGDIVVSAGQDVKLLGFGVVDGSDAQIGHGGRNVDGALSGAITVIGNTGIGARAFRGNTQIGHGAVDGSSTGNRHGDIYIRAGDQEHEGTLSLTDEDGPGDWWVGHRTAAGTIDNADVALVLDRLKVEETDPESAESVSVNVEAFRDMLVQNLEGGNVTLSSAGDQALGIHIPMAMTPAFCSNDISFLSSGDLLFQASVQKDGTGDINVVAGWDGSTGIYKPGDLATPSDAMFRMSEIVNNPEGSYGVDQGSVKIGDGTQYDGIAVGSRSGETNIYAYNLELNGSTATNGIEPTIKRIGAPYFSQLGYRVHGSKARSEYTVPGNIRVRLKGQLELQGGTNPNAYVQIGHGGFDPITTLENDEYNASYFGDINVIADSDVNVKGGDGDYAYAQVGHGGSNQEGTFGIEEDPAPVTVTSNTGEIYFLGGGVGSYAQLGHGGRFSSGPAYGSVGFYAGQTARFAAGDDDAYVQAGHGGLLASGDYFGNISTAANQAILFDAGGDRAYAQMGHGGWLENNFSAVGDIMLNAGVGTFFDADYASGQAYVQLGHGGYEAWGDIEGAINVDTGWHGSTTREQVRQLNDNTIYLPGRVIFLSGDYRYSYAQLGHGGYTGRGTRSGKIQINAGQESYEYNSAEGNDVSVRQTVPNGDGPLFEGGMHFVAPGGVQDAYVQLGHGGAYSSGTNEGDIEVYARQGIAFEAGGGPDAYAQLGHGGGKSSSDSAGNINVTVEGTVAVPADGGDNYIENVENDPIDEFTSYLPEEVEGLVVFAGGEGERSYAQMGHGGVQTGGLMSGDIELWTQGVVGFFSGEGFEAYAQLGHGGLGLGFDPVGDILVHQPLALALLPEEILNEETNGTVKNNLQPEGQNKYVMIGHGDGLKENPVECDTSGHIHIDVQDLTFVAFNDYSIWKIGHRGTCNMEGDTTLLTGRLMESGQQNLGGNSGAVIDNARLADIITHNIQHGNVTLGIRGGKDLQIDIPLDIVLDPYTLTLATEGDFINTAGASALGNSNGEGRWLVYSHDAFNIVKDGLAGEEQCPAPFSPVSDVPPLPTGPAAEPDFAGNGFLYIFCGEEPPPKPPEKQKKDFRGFLAYDHFVRHWQGILNQVMQRLIHEQSGKIEYDRERRDVFDNSMAGSSSFKLFGNED